jgi:hypothetical protein
MALQSVGADRGSLATLVSHRMGDQNCIISSSSVLRKARLVPATFAVVSIHQST